MILQTLNVFIATIVFGIIFKLPKRTLFNSGLAGVLGWGTYNLVFQFTRYQIFAIFLGVVVITIIAEISARLLREPATLFIVSGIIPLVPGTEAYFTMLHVLNKDYQAGLEAAVETLLIAGAISSGIIFVGVIARLKSQGANLS
ncbi:MAG: threonine/serine exporter family protein [Bacillota bacterium]